MMFDLISYVSINENLYPRDLLSHAYRGILPLLRYSCWKVEQTVSLPMHRDTHL